MNDALYNELIDYVNGKLSAERMAEIDSIVEQNDVARVELLTLQLTAELSTEAERHQLKLKLQQSKKNRQKSVGIVIALAAAASILLFVVFSPSSNERLYAEHYTPAAENVIMRDQQAPKGMTAYARGDYDQAIAGLTSAIETDPSLSLYLAISYMEVGLHESAKEVLQTPLSTSNSGSPEWYLVLCHLKLNEVDEARIVLENFPENTPYSARAADLLLQIK